VAAIGVDVNGDKHPLGVVEGATENAATVQALIGNLVERGLDPAVPHLFIIDGSKALSKAIRATSDATRPFNAANTQGAQHLGPPAEIDARPGETHIAAGLGDGRRRQGRDASSQPRSALEKDWEGVSAQSWKGSTRCSP